ncbi:MAG: heme-binding protein [Pelagibacterales bacterium]|nr:heme-binding protein [Pelagibacterales bacterium]
MQKIIFIVYIFFLLPYSTTMANEEASYDVVHKTDIYEVRYYSDRLVAQVTNKGDNNSFRKLFNYISGENKNSEKIAMTIPVTQTKKDGELFMQFYLPSKFNKETTPIPTNPDLEITTIPEGYFAVIKFSGRSSDKNFEKHNKILKQKLLEDKIPINGFAVRATYNSPFTLPPLRRNEAMFSIDWKS